MGVVPFPLSKIHSEIPNCGINSWCFSLFPCFWIPEGKDMTFSACISQFRGVSIWLEVSMTRLSVYFGLLFQLVGENTVLMPGELSYIFLDHSEYRVWIFSSLPSLQGGIRISEAVFMCRRCMGSDGRGFGILAIVQVSTDLRLSEPLLCILLSPSSTTLIICWPSPKSFDVGWV